MDILKISEKIVELSGGKENIVNVTHCMTRVRLSLKDFKLAKVEELKKLEKVAGVVTDETLQIIVGPGLCKKISECINEHYNFNVSEESLEENKESQKDGKRKLKAVLKSIANIFVPILPGLIAAGTILGINNIIIQSGQAEAVKLGIQAMNGMTPGQILLQQKGLLTLSVVLGIIGNALFGFLPIFTGVFAAKEFKATPILGGIIGAITIAPQLKLIGLFPGKGGLLGVIFTVFILAKIEKQIRKIIPNVLDVVMTPLISLSVVVILLLYAIMPAAGVASDFIINGLQHILNKGGVVAGFTLASLFPTLIAFGLHHGLAPIHMELINATGTTPLFAIQIMSNAGMVGAAIAVFLLTKDSKMKMVAKGAIPTSILAVGEPTIFGVNIPAGFAFITGSIGAGFGGVAARFFNVEATAYGAAGLSALPLIANGNYLGYIISWLIGCSAAFIITMITGKIIKYQ